MQVDFNILSRINLVNHTNKVKEKKSYDYVNQCRKNNIRQNSTPIPNQTYQNLGIIGNFLNLIKAIIKIYKLYLCVLIFNNNITEKSQKT